MTNTPSPGTDGAVCDNGTCDYAATNNGYHCCVNCGHTRGTGRAKADCAPVAEERPLLDLLLAPLEDSEESLEELVDRLESECPVASPSKRDATEVRRWTLECDDEGPFLLATDRAEPRSLLPRNTCAQVVLSRDHTAAIQASLAREAALEAQRDSARDAFLNRCADLLQMENALSLQAEKVGRMSGFIAKHGRRIRHALYHNTYSGPSDLTWMEKDQLKEAIEELDELCADLKEQQP